MVRQICKKTNYYVVQCCHRFDHSDTDERIPEALAALYLSDNTDQKFYTDSGATSHMKNNVGKIDNINFSL